MRKVRVLAAVLTGATASVLFASPAAAGPQTCWIYRETPSVTDYVQHVGGFIVEGHSVCIN